MTYTKEDFGRDLFFMLGFLESAIEKHNQTAKHKISEKRFNQFEKYCIKRFSDKKGNIKG